MKNKQSSKIILFSLFILLSLILIPVSTTQAAPDTVVCYVKWDAGGSDNGTSWANAYEGVLGVQSALADSTCTQIWVAQGLYIPGTNRTDSFQLNNSVTLYGGFDGLETALSERDIIHNETILSGNAATPDNDADNNYHVVTGSGTDHTAVLDGFTVSNGNANSSFPNNMGGGMYTDAGNPTVRNVIFKENTAGYGGGIVNQSSGANYWGITIDSNTATSYGGGIYNYNSDNDIIGNVTFINNNAGSGGGAIANYNSDTTFSHLTVKDNTTPGSGGGMWSNGSHPEVVNSIFWDNTATTSDDEIYDSSNSSPTISFSVIEGGYANGTYIITDDPLLGTIGDYGGRMLVIPILTDSSAIDTGDDGNCAYVDQRGISRTNVGTGCDIGAVEANWVAYATTGGATSGYCTNWSTACELSYALPNTFHGQEIWAENGSYKPTDDTNRAATFQLKSGVAVYGGFAGTETTRAQRDWQNNVTILSGDIGTPSDNSDNSYHVVTGSHTNGTAILDGFRIQHGNADGPGAPRYDRGGGMYIYQGTPTLQYVVFSLNTGLYGGGMHNYDADPTLTDVQFISNEAVAGGGGMNIASSSPTLINVTFDENAAQDGAGMRIDDNSNPSLTGVIFENNTASIYGGGILVQNSNPILTDVTFTSNRAYAGGGFITTGGSPTLTNTTFSQNRARFGGGVSISTGTLQMTTSTFDANTAQGEDDLYGEQNVGGGIYSSGDFDLEDVTFSNNLAYDGAGIYVSTGSPTLTDVAFNYNFAAYKGGGMYNDSSNPTITNATFLENRAWIDSIIDQSGGGGMYNDSSNPTITNVTFLENGAYIGGGMYNHSSNPTITNVTFSGNQAGGGGGMANDNGSDPLVTSTTFYNNDASDAGGGVSNDYSSPTFFNVTFHQNVAYRGGGMGNFGESQPTMSQVTFNRNSASSSGGGLYNNTFTSDTSTPEISNTIFWGNTGDYGPQIYIVGVEEPILDNNVIEGGCPTNSVCTNVITADPILGTFGDYGGSTQTIPLEMGSSALDAAGNTYTTCPATDQRGNSRPQNFICDIGAYEARVYTLNVSRDGSGGGTVTGDGISCGGDCTENYVENAEVTLTASPDSGSVFAGWSGACSGSGTCVVTMDQVRTVTATFNLVPPGNFALTVSLAGSGTGTVTGSGINCFVGAGADCTETYTEGTQVTLTASPDSGFTFTGWSGACTGTGSCVLTMNSAKSVIATFNSVAGMQYIYLPLVIR